MGDQAVIGAHARHDLRGPAVGREQLVAVAGEAGEGDVAGGGPSERPANLAILFREPFRAGTELPDPSDGRAKLVRATARGRELYPIAREVVAELETEWTRQLGRAKMRRLRALLEELNAGLAQLRLESARDAGGGDHPARRS